MNAPLASRCVDARLECFQYKDHACAFVSSRRARSGCDSWLRLPCPFVDPGSWDLFDLCAVATFEPEAIEVARPFMRRHAAAFLQRLDARAEIAELEFDEIDARSFRMSFWECLVLAHTILEPL